MSDRLGPVGEEQKRLCRLVEQKCSSVTVLVGDHGSGKTTQIPALVSEAFKQKANYSSMFVVPNGVNVRAVAAWMNKSPQQTKYPFANGKLAGMVHWADNIFELRQKSNQIITYITDELLEICLLETPEEIDKYSVIFIDDYHYRSTSTEVILLKVKNII
jgi:HrpA-like RNA helicase